MEVNGREGQCLVAVGGLRKGDQQVVHPVQGSACKQGVVSKRCHCEPSDREVCQALVNERQQAITAARFDPTDLDAESGRKLAQESRLLEGYLASTSRVEETGAHRDPELAVVANLLHVAGPMRGGAGRNQHDRHDRCSTSEV